jgi:hypothetical protein
VLVRLEQEETIAIIEATLPMICHQHMRGRWRARPLMTKLSQQSLQSLGTVAMRRVLPQLLALPLPGTPDWPEQHEPDRAWIDPIGALGSRQWLPMRRPEMMSTAIAQCLEFVQSSDAKIRKHAILRLSSLHSMGMLSRREQRQLTDALYRSRDEFGLPKDTGCYDSLVLHLPSVARSGELQLFRAKYLEREGVRDRDWEEIARTVVRFRVPKNPRRRSLSWRVRDLDAIVAKGEAWLEHSIERLRKAREQAEKHPFHAHFMGGETLHSTFERFVTTIDLTILLHPSVSQEQLRRVVDLFAKARNGGWDVVSARPSLCVLRSDNPVAVESCIQEAIMGSADETFSQGKEAIVRWCQLTQSGRKPAIPESLLVTLATLCYSPFLPHLPAFLRTASDVVNIFGRQIPSGVAKRFDDALRLLLRHVNYQDDELAISFNQRVSVRRACAGLASSMRRQGLSSQVIDEWLVSAKSDAFPEVRSIAE